MSDKRDQARNRWMQMFENIYPKYESLFSYGKELVVADAETLKTYGEDGKEYTLQMAPWEVEDQLACKLNNPDYSLLTEKSEVADAYIAGVAWGYNRGVKDCERGLQLSPETSTNTQTDIISRQGVIDAIEGTVWYRINKNGEMVSGSTNEHESWYKHDDIMLILKTIPSPPVNPKPVSSDGYHTFNQLYHQRAVLFATIVNQNKDKAWKSWKHKDGEFCFDKGGEWFIVGVDTPEGSYTYHYEQKYWDTFDCEELDRGKQWDGHTEEDVTRLLSLPPVEPTVTKEWLLDTLEEIAMLREERPRGEWKYGNGNGECPFCGHEKQHGWDRFCGFCGADMRGEEDD